MITGDYQHTAIAVAKDVGMADDTKPILLIEARRGRAVQQSLDTKTALSPSVVSQSNVYHSVVYASTGKQQMGSAASDKAAAAHAQGQADDVRVEDMTFEESAAIEHAPSIGVDPALYCTRRHVRFDTSQLQQQQQQSLSVQFQHQSPVAADQQRHPLSSASLNNPMQLSLGFGQQPLVATAICSAQNLNPSCPQIPPKPPPPPKRLKFTDTASGQEVEQPQALIALAEGNMQCAVTGDSFEQLLQQSDLSVLDLVMRNVVVFARMKPYQKGQVMDLLGRRGIYQMFGGRPRHVQVSLQTSEIW